MAREKAVINGIELKIETISDEFPKAIIKHEYPHVNGAELEDMGQSAHTINFRCFFDNHNYEEHLDLIDLLEETDLLELDHPRYGLMQGKIERTSIRHDDRIRLAEIDLTFVENLRIDIETAYREDVKGATETTFGDGQEQQADEFAEDTEIALGTEAKAITAETLDPGKSILEQFTGLGATARAYVGKISELEGKLEATLATISNPANSLIASIDYGVNLPGRIIGAIAKAAERYVILYENLADAPERFLQSFEDGLSALEESLELNETYNATTKISEAKTAAQESIRKHLQITGAQVAALDLAEMYAADEAERAEVRQVENTKSFDVAGNYVKTEPMPEIYTVGQIEKSLAAAREYLQAAIDQARKMQALKNIARTLLQHVNIIKLEREKIIQVEIYNPTPLHLICLMYGLPYNYAPRILSINPQISNTNFVSGKINIYAR